MRTVIGLLVAIVSAVTIPTVRGEWRVWATEETRHVLGSERAEDRASVKISLAQRVARVPDSHAF